MGSFSDSPASLFVWSLSLKWPNYLNQSTQPFSNNDANANNKIPCVWRCVLLSLEHILLCISVTSPYLVRLVNRYEDACFSSDMKGGKSFLLITSLSSHCDSEA